MNKDELQEIIDSSISRHRYDPMILHLAYFYCPVCKKHTAALYVPDTQCAYYSTKTMINRRCLICHKLFTPTPVRPEPNTCYREVLE